MRETRSYGSVRGAAGNSRPYRECRPHEGGAMHSGGRRPQTSKETAGRRAMRSVRRYGDFVADGVLLRCVDRLFGKRGQVCRTRSTDCDRQNRRRAAEIDRQGGVSGAARRRAWSSLVESRRSRSAVLECRREPTLIMMCRS